MSNLEWLLNAVRLVHEQIRSAVVSACETSSCRQISEVAEDAQGDTIYAIDRISDTLLERLFEENIASRVPILLIAEGLPGGQIILPRGTPEGEVVWQIIADPIDGTRCLMYQKRSGWILTGIAPNRGEATSLADIELAVQTEIPVIKQHLCDTLWALKGQGVHAERFNRLTGERAPLLPVPSTATTLAHGFATVARFFSGARDVLAAIDDEIQLALLGANPEGKARCFEDQYLSTAGQLYELIMGHDRFLADLRPLLRPVLDARGSLPGLCCHPYDLCTELIARQGGVIITSETGQALDAKLNVHADVSWIGYANDGIRRQVEPLIQQALRRHGLQPSPMIP